jgi:hypothetical protein
MEDKTLNTIKNDQYGMLEAFQEFTKNYFAITPDNTKTGLFGYINEIAAHVAKAGTFHRVQLYNEFSLNTASLPSTIYSAAADEDIDPNSASPARATIVLSFAISDLEGMLSDNSLSYVLFDRNNIKFTMDNLEFRLPYSLAIRKVNSGFSAIYLSTDLAIDNETTLKEEFCIHSSFEEYQTNPFIPAKTFMENDKQYLSLRFDIFQYSRQVNEETIYSTSLENRILYAIDYDDQIMSFRVLYKSASMTSFELLETFQNKYLVNENSDYCYYKYITDGTYQIYFDMSSSSFRPEINSSLNIESYTTKGTEGNITFNANPVFSDSTGNISFETTCVIYTQPHNGKDKPNLKELKKEIFKKRQKIYHKSSESDLNDYFSEISASVFGDGSKMIFVKTRDDLLLREWTGYSVIMDENKNPFPTNTLDILMPYNMTHIDSTTPLVLVSTDDISFLIPYDENSSLPALQDYITNVDKFIYFSPFSIYIDPSASMKAIYYNENLDEDYALAYESISSGSTSTPSIVSMNVYRNPSISEIAQLKLPVTAGDTNLFKFIIFFYTYDNLPAYWMQLVINDDGSAFIGEISVGNIFSGEKIKIENNNDFPIYSVSGSILTSASELYFSDSIQISIFALEEVDEANGITANFSNYAETINFDSFGFSGWRVKAKISPYENLSLFKNMGSILRSDVYLNDTLTSYPNTYWIKKSPVAGANILFSTDRYDYFISQYKRYITQLEDTVPYLTNNTSLNSKFYNTYGPSYFWNTPRTNISICIEVDREDGYDEEVDTNIKNLCKEFVLNINNLIDNKQALNNRIAMTRLSTNIENSVSSIESCTITSICEITMKRIEKIDISADSTESSGYGLTDVPEFLTIDMRRSPSNLTNVAEINVITNYLS